MRKKGERGEAFIFKHISFLLQAVLPECLNSEEDGSTGSSTEDKYYKTSPEEKVTVHEELVS